MAKITLDEINKESFGTRMPIVIIDKVEIDYADPESGSSSPINEFTYFLKLKFSKPEHIQEGSVKEFIRNNIGNLRLYGFTTYNTWVHEHLKQNKFSIEYWMRYAAANFTHLKYQQNMFHFPYLADLVDSDRFSDARVLASSTFDSDGNEIIEITNIKLVSQWLYYGMEGADGIPTCENVDDLVFMTFVGPDITGREGVFYTERFEEKSTPVSDYFSSGKTATNSYFGDISYYHVLSNNKVPSKFYEAYTTPSGLPYVDEVLQSLNGRFYSTDNFSFDDIKIRMEALIENYEENRELDPNLNDNLKTLEAIINASENRSGVLGEMSNYRSLYPNKSPTTLSGEFYAEFVVALSQLIETVQSQEELSVSLLYDSLVIDKRFNLLLGQYNYPNPSGKL